MKTYFHIGMGKTGSSALQNSLYLGSDYLEGLGILYPKDPRRPRGRNHKLFAMRRAPMERLPRHMKKFGSQERAERELDLFCEAIGVMLAERSPRLLLLSSETMFTKVHPGWEGRLRETLDALGLDPTFIGYVRRPSARYLSNLQQYLRASARLLPPKPPNYRAPIVAYQKSFGADRVRLHLYHPPAMPEGDITADFVARYLVPFGVESMRLPRNRAVNVSVSGESMTLLQAFRRDFHGTRDNKTALSSESLRATLREADAAVGAPRPRLHPEIAEAIDYANKAPIWLREQFGIEFPDFDYPRLAAGRLAPPPPAAEDLSTIVEIDPVMRQAIIGHVRESEWARGGKPAERGVRLRWLDDMLCSG